MQIYVRVVKVYNVMYDNELLVKLEYDTYLYISALANIHVIICCLW